MSEAKPENAPERKTRFIFKNKFNLPFLDCPGTQSEAAGKASACEGCPNQKICASAPKGPDPGNIKVDKLC